MKTTYPATLQPSVNGWNSETATDDYVRVMIPAVETVAVNGWTPGVWLMCPKWKKPRRFRGVRDGRVWLEGGSAVSFPEKVHRVSAPTPPPGVVRRRQGSRQCGRRAGSPCGCQGTLVTVKGEV